MFKFFHQKNVFLYYWTNKTNICRQRKDNGERGKYMKTNHNSIAPKCLIREDFPLIFLWWPSCSMRLHSFPPATWDAAVSYLSLSVSSTATKTERQFGLVPATERVNLHPHLLPNGFLEERQEGFRHNLLPLYFWGHGKALFLHLPPWPRLSHGAPRHLTIHTHQDLCIVTPAIIFKDINNL